MSPRRQAEQIYLKDGRNFAAEVSDHLRTGIVIDKPNCFALMKAEQLSDNRLAWKFNVTAGSLKALSFHIPWPMPFIALYRKPDKKHPNRDGDKLRVYPYLRFLTKSRNISFA